MLNAVLASFLEKWKTKSPVMFLVFATLILGIKGAEVELSTAHLLPSFVTQNIIDWTVTIAGLLLGTHTTPFVSGNGDDGTPINNNANSPFPTIALTPPSAN